MLVDLAEAPYLREVYMTHEDRNIELLKAQLSRPSAAMSMLYDLSTRMPAHTEHRIFGHCLIGCLLRYEGEQSAA